MKIESTIDILEMLIEQVQGPMDCEVYEALETARAKLIRIRNLTQTVEPLRGPLLSVSWISSFMENGLFNNIKAITSYTKVTGCSAEKAKKLVEEAYFNLKNKG